MLTVPSIVEDALRRAAAGVLGDAAVRGPGLTRAVVDRSRRYTSERELLALPADPDADLAARACFFSVADCAKPLVAFAELAHAGAWPAADPLRVVDLGAGCGAMSIGLVLHAAAHPGRRVEIALVDHDDRALAIAERAIAEVAAALGVSVATRVLVRDVAKATVTGVDLVLLGSVLNELDAEVAHAVAARALDAVGAEDGAVVIVEPALRETARALHALRDTLVGGGAHMFAPCGHDAVPCPMLAHERDWCHEERPVELPPRTRQLAATTGLREGALKLSYLVVRHAPGSPVPGGLRVVDAPRSQKGKHEVRVCSAQGYGVIRLLRRHRSDTNRSFERARRGDFLAIAPPLATGDLGPDHLVTVQRPAE